MGMRRVLYRCSVHPPLTLDWFGAAEGESHDGGFYRKEPVSSILELPSSSLALQGRDRHWAFRVGRGFSKGLRGFCWSASRQGTEGTMHLCSTMSRASTRKPQMTRGDLNTWGWCWNHLEVSSFSDLVPGLGWLKGWAQQELWMRAFT